MMMFLMLLLINNKVDVFTDETVEQPEIVNVTDEAASLPALTGIGIVWTLTRNKKETNETGVYNLAAFFVDTNKNQTTSSSFAKRRGIIWRFELLASLPYIFRGINTFIPMMMRGKARGYTCL